MFDHLPVASLVLAAIAALVHVYIFHMESMQWGKPAVRKTFGIRSDAEVEFVRPWAFNQGFYNLFLALGIILGIVLSFSADAATRGAGIGMIVLATGSMLAAALVLVSTNPKMLRAALVQGVAPLLALVLLFIL